MLMPEEMPGPGHTRSPCHSEPQSFPRLGFRQILAFAVPDLLSGLPGLTLDLTCPPSLS